MEQGQSDTIKRLFMWLYIDLKGETAEEKVP
jgi:hypothetical protein